MDINVCFGDTNVSQIVKSTAFIDDDDEKHTIYHAIIAEKPLCIHTYTQHDDNGSVNICTCIEKWSNIKHWYFDCLDNGECHEEVYHQDLLHLFDGLEEE